MGSEEDFVQIDAIGDWNGDPGSGWPVAGVNNGTGPLFDPQGWRDFWQRRRLDCSAGTNEEDSEWIVLDQNDWTGLGSHDFAGRALRGHLRLRRQPERRERRRPRGELTVMGCTDMKLATTTTAPTWTTDLVLPDPRGCSPVCSDGGVCTNSKSPTATATHVLRLRRVDTASWWMASHRLWRRFCRCC